MDEDDLWPTWTSVPALSGHAKKVKASLRIVGISHRDCKELKVGNCCPPPVTMSFYWLLKRYLSLGPVRYPRGEADKGVRIKLLELDVLSPDGLVAPREQLEMGVYNLSRLRGESGIDYLISSEFLADYLRRYVQELLNMNYHTARLGGLLYERIGRIRIMVDGEVKQEWDLAKELAKLEFRDCFGELERAKRPARFKAWKADAYKIRAELGLPIIEAEEVGED